MTATRFSCLSPPDCLLDFSKILYDEEMPIVCNSSLVHDDEEYIGVDSHLNPERRGIPICLRWKGKTHVLKNENDSRHFIKVRLKPSEFGVLTNQAINVA